MPDVIAPNEGLPALLDYMIRAPIVGLAPWQLGLFANDLVPGLATTWGDIVEPTWAGYTRYTLYRDQWTAPAVVSGAAVSTWNTDPVAWTNGSGAGVTVYGAFMMDPTLTVLRLIQRFDPGDIRELSPGQQLSFLPRVTLANQGLLMGVVHRATKRNVVDGVQGNRHRRKGGIG